MIDKIRKMLDIIREIKEKYPDEPILLEMGRWERRLIEYLKIKEIQNEIQLV